MFGAIWGLSLLGCFFILVILSVVWKTPTPAKKRKQLNFPVSEGTWVSYKGERYQVTGHAGDLTILTSEGADPSLLQIMTEHEPKQLEGVTDEEDDYSSSEEEEDNDESPAPKRGDPVKEIWKNVDMDSEGSDEDEDECADEDVESGLLAANI